MEPINKNRMSMETAGVSAALSELYEELLDNGYYKGLYEYSIEDFKKLDIKGTLKKRENGLFYVLYLHDGIEYRITFFTAGEFAHIITGVNPDLIDEFIELYQTAMKNGEHYIIRTERK